MDADFGRVNNTINSDYFCGLYFKPMKIINEDSRAITKLETSLTNIAKAVIYHHQMFIVQATGFFPSFCQLVFLDLTLGFSLRC
jgi:hypothetical protein